MESLFDGQLAQLQRVAWSLPAGLFLGHLPNRPEVVDIPDRRLQRNLNFLEVGIRRVGGTQHIGMRVLILVVEDFGSHAPLLPMMFGLSLEAGQYEFSPSFFLLLPIHDFLHDTRVLCAVRELLNAFGDVVDVLNATGQLLFVLY